MREAADLCEDAFDGIRDLFRTSAGAENILTIKWAMEHTMRDDDSYAYRGPKETAAIMAKVEEVVFGEAGTTTPSRRSAKSAKPRR